jgi:uncharacterized membrane protein
MQNIFAQKRDWRAPLVVLALALVAAVLPSSAIHALDLVGYAVCHRIPDRSFIIAGNQLPVCARDTGMFIGALMGVLAFAVLPRRRVAGFPRWPFTLALLAFFGAWGFDGFNSYLLLILGHPFLYMPQNWLRLVTGAFMGVTLSTFVVPLFNQAVWPPELTLDEPSITSWKDIGRLAVIAVAIILVVLWQPAFLYGPLALLSVLGVVGLLSMVNGLLVMIASRRSQKATQWRQVLPFLLIGLALAALEIAAIDLARASLTRTLGLPY